ncbi:MAG: cytochrome c-type biogenesis protein CcmH [Candidatus Dactylopiibacterium sp.]|nr:cytochrome c-type biogenesis protein CcmH [Candidatus Dactylopiibacterium sp.]
MRKILLALLLAAQTGLVMAQASAPEAALDARVMKIAHELRCLVCQNESIADSTADLAQDLRREIREMFLAGKSEADVRRFLVERYGDFVLYDPPVKRSTWLLWGGPAALLVAALGAFAWQLARRRHPDEADAAPDAATLATARRLLDAKDDSR